MSSKIVDYDRKALLGEGIAAQVFLGTFAGNQIAVKKIQKRMEQNQNKDVKSREDTSMKQFDHPNVLKLIEIQEDVDFKYLILELCLGTLRDYIRERYTGTMPSELDGMIQMASGLQYIHDQKFVHRDIKPENVLISKSHVLKISDFGFCRPVTGSGSFSMSSGPKGTKIYNSPEYLRIEEKPEEERGQIRANVSIDIFSLGCVFFSYITKGGHPFATGKNPVEFETVANIYKGEKFIRNVNSDLSKDYDYALPMIDGMTEFSANNRWSLQKVLEILKNQNLKSPEK
ncbi:serine/threonine-protein kinase/endoribonuclease IRE1-like [Daphnia carinata]|uniref:serine/threonine-protein kinase/endoribonuclease IRE1-like n=1 Tax=Daphnia carinata TaxID=120202 RepID=UPI00257FDC91|nr:serine/threonine-protein kinase/endoribonuclease IRE1-like [Daphnia carinata]